MSVLFRWVGRAIGLDVHRDFCVIAICEDGSGSLRGSGPEHTRGDQDAGGEPFAVRSGGVGGDWQRWEVARILEPHVERVIVVSPDDTGIVQARAKTDRLDARALARLLWKGELESVWRPDERCGVLRRRLARREQLVHARTRAKQEVHAVLARRLQGKPPSSDLFGVKGRQWLASLELPLEERESVDAALRHINFLDHEIGEVERLIAQQALAWPEIRRLMTVPGVNLICAASFMAAIGDVEPVHDQPQTRRLSGLDPKVRQSGEAPARSGRISKRGSASARWALVEAAWTAVRQPGPLHAFYERTRGRRGHGKAIVASARKLAVLFWCMLTRGEDYAHQQPSLTARSSASSNSKPAPRSTPRPPRDLVEQPGDPPAERQLAEQAETSYKRLVQDQQAGAPAKKVGASATPERA